MQTEDLASFERAYQRVERRLQLDRDWGQLESSIRRRLHRPTWRLWQTVLLVGICFAATAAGVSNGWLVGLGICLAVLPGRVSDVRSQRRALAAIESRDDVRDLLRIESRRQIAGLFLRALATALFGLLYLAVALVAWLLDRSPWPGIIAGLLVIAWSAVTFLVFFPRAARESSLLASDPSDEHEKVDDDD